MYSGHGLVTNNRGQTWQVAWNYGSVTLLYKMGGLVLCRSRSSEREINSILAV